MQDLNLSRQKREELINICNQLKEKSPEDATNINHLIQFIKDQKYGLQFEKHREQVDIDLLTKIPVFTEDKGKKIASDALKPYNFLLEGDNLHSLKLLEKTHCGAIDVIYIDPPYNTGNEFIYNDKIVVEEDGYRHSKWLSFMVERLKIAYKLLNKGGIIFISIGDDEVAQLKMICDDIFGETNKLGLCPRIAKKGSNKGTYFRPTKDYVLCYAKNKKDVNPFCIIQENNESDYKFIETTGPNVGKKYKKGHSLFQASLDARPNQRYYIEAPDGTLIIPPGNVFPEEKKDGSFVIPVSNDDKCYRWSYESYLKHKDEGIIMFDKSKKSPFLDSDGNPTEWNVYEKKYYNPSAVLTTLPDDVIYDCLNAQGQTELAKIGVDFSFSKPVSLLKYLLSIINKPNDITVLDFFAGSGTTAQAVLELNNEDGGNRKFILCTNNENNICEEITYQRIKTVITGVRADGSAYSSGVPANLKYFKTDFVERNTDVVPDELAQHCSEMIELQHGINVDPIGVFDAKNILLKDDDEADLLYENFSNYQNLEAIYIIEDTNECDSVILTNAQLDKFKNIPIISVPRWYFENEIMEAK